MSEQMIIHATLNSDGTLELDEKPNLSPGRVRLTLEPLSPQTRPDRFWAMMEEIWTDLKASDYVPRSVEEIEGERRAFRDEWDQHQEALERIHREQEGPGQSAVQPEEPSR